MGETPSIVRTSAGKDSYEEEIKKQRPWMIKIGEKLCRKEVIARCEIHTKDYDPNQMYTVVIIRGNSQIYPMKPEETYKHLFGEEE